MRVGRSFGEKWRRRKANKKPLLWQKLLRTRRDSNGEAQLAIAGSTSRPQFMMRVLILSNRISGVIAIGIFDHAFGYHCPGLRTFSKSRFNPPVPPRFDCQLLTSLLSIVLSATSSIDLMWAVLACGLKRKQTPIMYKRTYWGLETWENQKWNRLIVFPLGAVAFRLKGACWAGWWNGWLTP